MQPPQDFRRLGEAMMQTLLPQIEEAYKTLSPRRQLVLDKYFGISSGVQIIGSDLGKKLGISKQRAYQLKESAMNDLIPKFCEIAGFDK